MKIYIVQSGFYDDVDGVFSTKELADARRNWLIKHHSYDPDDIRVVTWAVDDPSVIHSWLG